MAEVLGAVASGITIVALAARIGQGVAQLQDFLTQVKEAPEDIVYMLEDIEALSSVLGDIDTVYSHTASTSQQNPKSFQSKNRQRCSERCLRVAKIIEEVMKECEVLVAKGKWRGGVRVVMKKEGLKRLRERLQSAQMLLFLSNQAFSHASLEQSSFRVHQTANQTLQLVQRLGRDNFQSLSTEAVTCVTSQSTDITNRMYQPRQVGTRKTQSKRTGPQHQVPAWLQFTKSVLEGVAFWHTSLGWQISLRPYTVMRDDCLAIKCCTSGDLETLRGLFMQGKASAFDYTRNGRSLLWYAALKHDLLISSFLLEVGADPMENKSNLLFTPALDLLNFDPWSQEIPSTEDDIVKIANLILPKVDADEYFGLFGRTRSLSTYPRVFSCMLEASNFSYQKQSMEMCFEAIMDLRHYVIQVAFASNARIILQGKELCIELLQMNSTTYGTIFHCAAFYFGQAHGWAWYRDTPLLSQSDSGAFTYPGTLPGSKAWLRLSITLHESFVKDLLNSGADFHNNANKFGTTPLLHLLQGASYGAFWFSEVHSIEPAQNLFSNLFMSWLHILESCAIDPVKYMRKEAILYSQIEDRVSFTLYCKQQDFRYRILSFTYRPNSMDWEFCFVPILEEWFHEFWDMVDHPERNIPGYWHEEFDSDGDSDYDSE